MPSTCCVCCAMLCYAVLPARVVYTVGNLHTSASAEIVSSILVKQDLDSFFRNGERENEIQPLVNKL